MSAIELPLNAHARVDWKKFFADLESAGTLLIHERDAKRIYPNARFHGKTVQLKWLEHGNVSVTLLPDRPVESIRTSEIAKAEARHANLHNRIAEAITKRDFWKIQIAVRLHPDGISQAKAAYAAWKMTAEQLTKEFEAKHQTATA